jgi:outer membrane protein OmpU
MNNFKKIGLTALASSLVAVSAHAGEMSVSGSLGATYSTQSGDTDGVDSDYAVSGSTPNHASGLGTDKDFSVSGSGELDNGWTFSGYTLLKDTMTLSSSGLSMTMGSIGTLSMGTATGGNSTKYDVQTPTAYEEVDDGGAISLSSNYVGNFLDSNAIQYASPSYDLGLIGDGMSMTFHVEYAPEASDTATNDGGAAASSTWDNGQSLGITLEGNGVKFGVYGAEREAGSPDTSVADAFTGVTYLNYTYQQVSVGYSMSYHDNGHDGTTTAATTAKAVGVANGIFESDTMSIAFNVNDNLSISYAKSEDTYDAQSNVAGGTEIADVSMDMKSIQAAYSMGAMSIKAYRTETDNVEYQTNGGSLTVNEIAVGLAF